MNFTKYQTCKQSRLYDFCHCDNSGFTLVEIVSVIVILSIISAVAASRFCFSDSNLGAQTEAIKVYLRYAQVRSMNNTESVWGIRCAGTSLWLYKDGDTTNRVRLPGEDSDTVNLDEKGISMAEFTLSFDSSVGKPCTDAAAETEQNADRTLTVNSDAKSSNITITKNTGFIP